jgi:hypothetical protein
MVNILAKIQQTFSHCRNIKPVLKLIFASSKKASEAVFKANIRLGTLAF